MAACWAEKKVASTAARRVDVSVCEMAVYLAEKRVALKVWQMAERWAAYLVVKVANWALRKVASMVAYMAGLMVPVPVLRLAERMVEELALEMA